MMMAITHAMAEAYPILSWPQALLYTTSAGMMVALAGPPLVITKMMSKALQTVMMALVR